jgi:hypothetical protein
MNYVVEYFHSRVKDEIESWPDGILADYARLVELLMEFGPNLRMPPGRAMGGGLFRIKATLVAKGSDGRFTVLLLVNAS